MALSFVLMLLRIVGTWPGNPIQKIVVVMLVFSFHFSFIGLVGQVCTQTQDIIDVAEFLYSVLLNLLVTAKYYHILLTNKQFIPLVNTLETVYRLENKILHKSAQQARRISIIFFSFSFFTAIGFAVFPMLENTYLGEVRNGTYIPPNKLSYKIWIPHIFETPVFEISYFWIALCCLGLGYFLSAYDCFLVTLVILVCGLFKLLQSASRDVFIDRHESSATPVYVKNKLEESVPCLELTSRTNGHDKIQTYRVASRETKPFTWEEASSNLELGPGELHCSNRKLTAEERLIQIIKYHQSLLGVVDELNKYFSSMMLLQFVCSMSLICLTGFQTLRSTPGGLEFVFRTCYLLMVVTELYVLCWTGQQLTQESVLVADSTYESDWTSATNSLKKSQKLLILRAQRPVTICIGKFTTLGIRAFTDIIRASYSFFTVLREFLNSENREY